MDLPPTVRAVSQRQGMVLLITATIAVVYLARLGASGVVSVSSHAHNVRRTRAILPQQHKDAQQEHQQQESEPPADASSAPRAASSSPPPLLSSYESSLPPVPPPATDSTPSVAQLLATYNLLPASSKEWKVVSMSGFFGSMHPWASGGVECPGGCRIEWTNNGWGQPQHDADILLLHDDSRHRRLEPVRENQLIALWASETMNGDLLKRGDAHYDNYHTEMTYRTIGFHRDAYMSHFIPYMRIAEGRTAALERIRSWSNLFDAPVPFAQRRSLAEGTISFASSHCTALNGRENLVQELMKHVPVVSFGGNCFANAKTLDPETERKDKRGQHDAWRRYKFHLAFENHNCVDYVTEKIYTGFLTGQVPVFYGAPNAAEHTPPHSYIDASAFPSVAALGAYLKRLDTDEAEYAKYHAWRTASFDTFGVYFKRELLRWIAALHHVGPTGDTLHAESVAFRCAMCYGLQQWAELHAFTPPAPAPVRRHILDFNNSCTPGWSNVTGFGGLPFTGWTHTTAAAFYGRAGVTVPQLHFDDVAKRKTAAPGAR